MTSQLYKGKREAWDQLRQEMWQEVEDDSDMDSDGESMDEGEEEALAEMASVSRTYEDIMMDLTDMAELDEGGYGIVSSAKYYGRCVCVKTAKFESERGFVKEAKVMYDLAGAGGAPILYAIATDRPLIVMELCKGKTLADFIIDTPSLTKQQ